MAEFNKSYPLIKQNEGGYANNPKDRGKETYCGISRKYHPTWSGWSVLDRIKKKGAIKNNTIINSLNPIVQGFYFHEYWEKLYLAYFSQDLATQLFDFAVNSGKGAAVKKLQIILNSYGHKLKIDGAMGKNTARAVQAVNNKELATKLFNARSNFVNAIAKKQPHFANAWKARLNNVRNFVSSPTTKIVTGLAIVVALGFIFKKY